jgi:NADPH-ferrihemoprotein reductase
MIGSIILVVLAVGVWLWLRSLGPKAPAGSNSVRSPTTASNAVARTAADRPQVHVLYGTQTGNAQSLSKTLAREAHRFKVPINVTDLEEYNTRHLADEKVVIFVVSTYGEGEPPDTMKPLYDWLMKDATSDDVANLKFAVFGLGDRQYKFYAQMGVAIDERLADLGAERLVGLGCGDAGQALEEDFDQWRQSLWPAVGHAIGRKLDADSEEPVEPELTLKKWEKEDAGARPFVEAPPMMEPTQAQPIYAAVLKNDELLRESPGRQTRRIEFDVSGSSLSYQAGDHLGVLPCNSDDIVQAYLQVLGAEKDADTVVSLADHTGRNQLPTKQPLRLALKWFIDLSGAPKKSTLRAFAHYCSDTEEKQALLSVLRTNDTAMARYHTMCHQLRTTLGFLKNFSSCKVPLAAFLEFMPRIAPRFFSISSDQLLRPTSVAITVALVNNGVCTTMLCGAGVGDRVALFVRKSAFHLPLRDKKRPLVMIGPGTGIAPLIGFCERREAWRNKGQEVGPAALFFGCRNKAKDFIHEDYLRASEQTGILTFLDVCFSRDQAEKIYVQHRIAQRAGEVWGLIEQGANVYICGDAKHMAKDVERTFIIEVFQKAAGMSPAAAEQKLKDLVKADRYHKDVWSA